MAVPVLFLPGLMCDAAVFAAQRAALSAHRRCLTAEYGRADSLPAMAQGALGRFEGECVLIGHSMGGRVALEIARQAPSRVRALALLDTGCHALAAGEPGAREVAGRMQLLAQARTAGVAAMAASWVPGMVEARRLCDRALLDAIIAMFARQDAEVFAAQLKALIERPDASALLPTIAVPALLQCGEQDGWSPPAQHRAMAALLPHASLKLIANCGHMSTLEQPQVVTATLLRWLDGLDLS